jgi:hypothetical protein
MLYPSSGATIRHDLNTVVEEGAALEEGLIGLSVLPPLAVAAKSGTYPKIQLAGGALMDAVATVRERGGSYGRISRKYTTDTYDCVDYGLEEPVDDVEAKDLSRFLNAETTAARLTRRNLLLAHEVRAAAALLNTTNFGSATNSSVAYTVANLATVSFIDDVLTAIETLKNAGVMANSIVMGSQVMTRIKQATKVQAWVRGTLTGNIERPVNASNLALSFADEGIKNVFVGRARQNTAKKGQTVSASAIWGTTYVWVGQINAGATDPRSGGAGFTLHWSEEGGLFTTETYRDEATRSNMVRVRQNVTEKITDGTAGALIATQYS